MFLPTENCISGAMFLRQTACHRGCSQRCQPRAKPQPRVEPNLLPRWQPSLQLESPFLWPLLSTCSSSETNTPARKSGTQSLSLSKAEHVSQQFLAHFVVHIPWCLHVLVRVAGPWHSNRGARELSLGVCSLGAARTPWRAGGYYARGRGGGVCCARGLKLVDARLCAFLGLAIVLVSPTLWDFLECYQLAKKVLCCGA